MIGTDAVQSFAANPKVGRGPFRSSLVLLRRIWSERKLRSGYSALCAVGQEIARCRPRLPNWVVILPNGVRDLRGGVRWLSNQ